MTQSLQLCQAIVPTGNNTTIVVAGRKLDRTCLFDVSIEGYEKPDSKADNAQHSGWQDCGKSNNLPHPINTRALSA